jgi:hypothetical protein
MKWFRSNIKSGARLALFALFVHFALSYGHFHALATPSPGATQSTLAHTKVNGGSDFTVQSEQAKLKQARAKQDNDQNGADSCAICAVMAMAGTVLAASPPLLLLPEAVELLYRSTDAEFIHLKSAGTSFRPRAPPAS